VKPFLFRCLIAAPLLSPGVFAQPASDWTGFYVMARGHDLEGLKPLADLDKLVIAHLQPWAKAKLETTDGVADDTGQVCLPNGPFRYPVNAGQFLWLPGRDKIVIVFWEINTAGVRRIYLNRSHPRNLLPTWNGDSIGHWEGDTLVVDTIGVNDKSWLFLGMEPHSEETHMIERISRIKDGAMIENDVTIEDRQALTSAYSFTRYYKKSDPKVTANGEVVNVCNEDPKTWKAFRDQRLKPSLERARQVK
jgi:hypothetical protein